MLCPERNVRGQHIGKWGMYTLRIFLSQDTDLGSPKECSARVAGDCPVVSPRFGGLQVTNLAPRAHDDLIVSSILFNE